MNPKKVCEKDIIERYSVTGLLLFSDEVCNLSNWSRVLGWTLRQLLQSKAFNCA